MSSQRRRLVLCVDDEGSRLHIRELVLQSVGYKTLSATSGREGLRLFQSQDVDAVVLDYSMPDLEGGMVAAAMKQLKPHVPVLMLSGYVQPPSDALPVVDAYITKGTGPEVVLERLEALLHIGAHVPHALRGRYVASVDAERRYVDVTDGVCELLGYSREELLQMRIDDVTLPGTADVPSMFSTYRRKGSQKGRFVLRHRSGKPIPIRYHSIVFPDGCMVASWQPEEK